MRIKLNLTLFLSLLFVSAVGRDFTITSPDKKISVTIAVGKTIAYSVNFKNEQIISPSAISMTLGNGTIIGKDAAVKASKTQTVDKLLTPLYGISSTIREYYNELDVEFKSGFHVLFRVYNEGFAYRFVTNFTEDVTVTTEQSDFKFAENNTAYFHPILSEANYRPQLISDFKPQPNYTSLPLLVKNKAGLNILIHEADVASYPCLTLAVDSLSANSLRGVHAKYPRVAIPGGYNKFNLVVQQTEPFIAKTTGKRSFPWRIVAFAEADKDILKNQLVYLLAAENKLKDVSWIRPGKVAWDWWNSLNLSGVKFQTGFNTDTYKYFIDFAARNGIPYVNLDEGWSDQFDLMKVTDKLDMPELIRYAKGKKVGLILWCVWHTLDKQMDVALNQFEKWGIAGVKVDFMDRDDQVVVEFHEHLLQETAKRKMLVDYHGAYHPTGFQRTYPNNVNVEGVRGLEWNKFDKDGTSPGHDVTIPFIRMFAGSMDYTPGAMQNYNQKDWKQIFDRPMSQGTRAHQLAMYVVYFAPLQMLSDAPTAYEKEPEILNFLATVPTVWDEVYPLDGEAAQFVALARRKGNDWYAGAMTNWDARTLTITLDFLQSGKTYETDLFADGANADRVGNDYSYSKSKQTVKKGDTLVVKMAPGGGWAAKFKLIN